MIWFELIWFIWLSRRDSCSCVFWYLLGACCDNALHLGDGLRLRPLRLCCSMWVSAFVHVMIQMWLLSVWISLFFDWGYLLFAGAWIINAQCILCLWTRMRTWLLRRSRWPCTQTTCQPAASPTQTCRWEYPSNTKTHLVIKMFIEISVGKIIHVYTD